MAEAFKVIDGDLLPRVPTDLRGHLRATNDGCEGSLGLLHGALEVVKFLLKEEPGDRGREVLGDTLRGAVRTVSGTEGIVHEEIEGLRQLLREVCRMGKGTTSQHPTKEASQILVCDESYSLASYRHPNLEPWF